jgi:hypothetical protein
MTMIFYYKLCFYNKVIIFGEADPSPNKTKYADYSLTKGIYL